jgi:prepilin-type N-terminal cleavage/methylation domain-containing protein
MPWWFAMQSSERGGGAHARTRGFTLIEVLGAVLVLGVLYTVLAGVAIEGLHAEGTSMRRLEASLLADRLLVELEEQIAAGSMPPIGVHEDEEDIFDLAIAVRELELASIVPPEPFGSDREVRPASAASLFGNDSGTQPSRLREIDVRVTWLELDREISVQRTSYAFDASGLEGLFPEGGEAPEEATTEEDDEIPQGLKDLGLDADAIEALKRGELPQNLR